MRCFFRMDGKIWEGEAAVATGVKEAKEPSVSQQQSQQTRGTAVESRKVWWGICRGVRGKEGQPRPDRHGD